MGFSTIDMVRVAIPVFRRLPSRAATCPDVNSGAKKSGRRGRRSLWIAFAATYRERMGAAMRRSRVLRRISQESVRMRNTRRIATAFAGGFLLGAVVLVSVWRVDVAASADRSNPIAAYGAVSEMAARGDERAIRLKSDLDQYLESHSMSVDDLGALRATRTDEQVGITRFRLKGTPPWEVSVFNDTIIDTLEDYEGYAALRSASLYALANRTPSRDIDFVVTMNRLVPLSDVPKVLACDCRITEVAADVFVGNVWVMSAGSAYPQSPLSDFQSVVVDDLAANVNGTLDMFSDLQADDLTMFVHWIRVRSTAASAAEVSQRPDILLVDPTSDIADFFATRAASVSVVTAPDVFNWYARDVLKLELKPTTIVPNPGEDGMR